MAIRSSCGFSHLRPGAFYIALQTHKTQHTQPRGWKRRRTNKYELGLVPSTKRETFVTLSCGFLCIWLLRACIRAQFLNSHQERWLILSRGLTWFLSPQIPTLRLAATPLWPSPSSVFCWLPWDLAFPRLLPVSQEISRASPLCRFRAKTDKGILGLALTHTHRNECHLSCYNFVTRISEFLWSHPFKYWTV